MKRHALFVGGPLNGQLVDIGTNWRWEAVVPAEDIFKGPEPGTGKVHYNISRLWFMDRVIWIGYLGNSPDEKQVADMLLSPEAKLASEPG